MLSADMKRVIREQRLGFLATVNPDGTPNVSPKATFVVLDGCHDRLRGHKVARYTSKPQIQSCD